MAHNINRNRITGKDSFFSVKEKAWHGLGQIVEDYPTSEEAIIFAGLDFEVEKLPNRHKLPSGKEIISDNSFYTYRKDTEEILGDKLGKDYKVVQNKATFTFFDSLVNDGTGIKYETAGALGNGERIFITAKMPDVMKIGRGSRDEIEKYIFLSTSHDGSGSIIAALTPVRIVCANTLRQAMANHSDAVNIRHTANAEEALKEAARIMNIAETESKLMEELFNKWAKVRINDSELKKLVQLAMSPNKEVFKAVAEEQKHFEFSKQFQEVTAQVLEYAMSAPSQQMETTAGTLFGAYNAITGYYQNVKSYKSQGDKLDSIMFGTGLERTKKAFDLCLKANEFLS